MVPTHVLGVNGKTWMTLQEIDKGKDDDIAKLLSRLDGSEIYSLLLWKLPAGKSLYDVKPKRDAKEYIQSAGTADRMTVEVRRKNGGAEEHFVVGRPPNGGNPAKKEIIHWDSVETVVASNEVFSADEAAELFLSYHRTGWVPSTYVLRPIST